MGRPTRWWTEYTKHCVARKGLYFQSARKSLKKEFVYMQVIEDLLKKGDNLRN